MYKKLLWIAAIAFSFALNQSASANSWGCGEGIKKMILSLKLDKDQQEKVKPILEQLKSSIASNEAPMQDVSKQINEQVLSPTMDQSTVDQLVDKKTQLIGNMIKAKLTAKNQIFAILRPEQKTKLQGMMKNLEEKVSAKFKNCHAKD